MEFTHEAQRIYATDDAGKLLAEITFPTSDGIADINHTFVDDSLRGQGIASQLVRAAADQIKADGNKIKASCSYAVGWFAKHEGYDVVIEG